METTGSQGEASGHNFIRNGVNCRFYHAIEFYGMKCQWACRRNEWRINTEGNEEGHQGMWGTEGRTQDDSWFEPGQQGKYTVNTGG